MANALTLPALSPTAEYLAFAHEGGPLGDNEALTPPAPEPVAPETSTSDTSDNRLYRGLTLSLTEEYINAHVI